MFNFLFFPIAIFPVEVKAETKTLNHKIYKNKGSWNRTHLLRFGFFICERRLKI